MVGNKDSLQDLVVSRLLQLNAIVYGAVAGLFIGLGVFTATVWLVIKGGDVIGPHLALLGQFFLGYEVTLLGSVVGFAYGFLYGFIAGYLAAFIYNWIVMAISKGATS